MKMSITDARKLGIASSKNRKTPHYADVARETGKTNTQLKAWAKLTKKGSK